MRNAMFDPFNDFDQNGYLQNIRKDKNEAVIKHFEHNLFRANLPDALDFLASRRSLIYRDFLEVHRILFESYYPWAGRDRSSTLPDRAVMKGNVLFCHPLDAKRAVESGLTIGQKAPEMAKRPGEVMGLFAYGHPFLDGNGRTMLIVHLELAYRAGFSISWADTKKASYLAALGQEIERPGQGALDSYLLQFKGPRAERNSWGKSLLSMRGLDGLGGENVVDQSLADPTIEEKYREFERKRNYQYEVSFGIESANSDGLCESCEHDPCVCGGEGQVGVNRQRS